MIVRKFQPEDGMAVKDDLVESKWNGVFTRKTFCSITGPGYTVVHAGKVIGCGGVIINGGEGEAWCAFSKSIPLKTALNMAIIVKKMLANIIEANHLRRVYARVGKNFRKGRRYVKFLGFKPVGPIGAETLMYVREA